MTEPRQCEQAEDHGSHVGVPSGSMMDVVYVCALAASVAGLYFGMHYDSADVREAYPGTRVASAAIPEGVIPATAYAEIAAGSLGPNAAQSGAK